MRTLKQKIEAYSFEIPYSDNTYALATPLKFFDKTIPNRIVIIAPYGGDAAPTGEFSIYSHRRYARFAGEGAGFIITEPVAPSESIRRSNRQLCLNEHTLCNFKNEVEFIKNLSVRENNISPNIILKLDLREENSDIKNIKILSDVCFLAEQAGFDGIETELSCNINTSALLSAKSNVSNNFIFAVDLNDYVCWTENLRKIYEQRKIFDKFIVAADLKADKRKLEALCNNISLISSLQKQNPDIYDVRLRCF